MIPYRRANLMIPATLRAPLSRHLPQDIVDNNQLRLIFESKFNPGDAVIGLIQIGELVADQQFNPIDDHIMVIDDQQRLKIFWHSAHGIALRDARLYLFGVRQM